MITLHIYLRVTPGREEELGRVYHQVYLPAVSTQRGFHGSALLRAYDQARTAEISGRHDWPYEIDIVFDSEENRRAWAGGPEHIAAWPAIEALCDGITWQGFDITA